MGALISGVTIFLLIVVFLVYFMGFGAPAGAAAAAPGQAAGANPAAGAQSIPILTYLAAGMGVMLLPLSFILPDRIAAQSLRSKAVRPPDASSNPTTNSAASPGQ
ncbi:MAG: hypothetical protein ACLQVF_20650, partial [Isosphaeraceae bacterium]